jgi:hypothetical protein
MMHWRYAISVQPWIEISWMWMRCRASSPAMTFDFFGHWQGFQMQAALWCLDVHVHMTAVMCWVFPTTPAEPALLWWSLLHTDSMTVSQHARKAPAHGVAQFGSFRNFQPVPRTLARRVLHEWGQWTPHSYRWRCQVHREFGYPLSRRHTSWPENLNMGAPLHIFRAPPLGKETALHVSWLLSTDLRAAVQSVWTLFLDCHELPVPLGTLEMIHSYLGKFRHF